MHGTTPPSHRRTDLIAGASLVVAVIVAALLGYRAISGFLGLTDDLTRVVVPGTSEFALTESGSYTIFYEHRSNVGGRAYRTPEALQGLRVAMQSLESGSLVAITTPGSDVEYSTRGHSGYSVLSFRIDEPGRYELTAFYEDGSSSPEIVLAIGQGVGRQIVVSILTGIGAVAIFLTGAAATIALAVIPRVRLTRSIHGSPR